MLVPRGSPPRSTVAVLVGAAKLLRARGVEPTAKRVREVAGLAGSFVRDGLGHYEAVGRAVALIYRAAPPRRRPGR